MRKSAAQLEGQLEIDVHLTGRISPVEDGSDVASVVTPETEPLRVFPDAAPVAELDEVTFSIEGITATRRSPKLGKQIDALVDAQTMRFYRIEPDQVSDREAAQWIDDYETIQVCVPAVCARLGSEPNPRNATQGGIYAEVIERIVGKRARPAYEETDIPPLEDLLDPDGVMREVLGNPVSRESEAEHGNWNAAADVAMDTRDRAKVAVARARFLEKHPDIRLLLESRFV